MQCPNCNKKYAFFEVPFENRNMKFLITEFICPYCGALISPDKKFELLIACSMFLFTLSLILIIIGFKTNSAGLTPGIITFILSIMLFIVSKLTLRYKVIKK